MNETLKTHWQRTRAWIARDEHRQRARELSAEVKQAFTEHPAETGETYLEHLWFTTKMSVRFLYTTAVMMIHGVFPFLLMRTASSQIESVYKVMRGRVPKARRDAIDAEYHL